MENQQNQDDTEKKPEAKQVGAIGSLSDLLKSEELIALLTIAKPIIDGITQYQLKEQEAKNQAQLAKLEHENALEKLRLEAEQDRDEIEFEAFAKQAEHERNITKYETIYRFCILLLLCTVACILAFALTDSKEILSGLVGAIVALIAVQSSRSQLVPNFFKGRKISTNKQSSDEQ